MADRSKPRSPYFRVKIASAMLGLLAAVWLTGAIYLMFEHNAQGEYCDYVEPGAPYHLILENGPCRITSQAVIEIVVFAVLLVGASQFLPFIFWALTAYQIRLAKNPPPLPDDWNFRRDFGEFLDRTESKDEARPTPDKS